MGKCSNYSHYLSYLLKYYMHSTYRGCQEEEMYVFLGIDIFEHEIFKYYTKRSELDVAILSFVF